MYSLFTRDEPKRDTLLITVDFTTSCAIRRPRPRDFNVGRTRDDPVSSTDGLVGRNSPVKAPNQRQFPPPFAVRSWAKNPNNLSPAGRQLQPSRLLFPPCLTMIFQFTPFFGGSAVQVELEITFCVSTPPEMPPKTSFLGSDVMTMESSPLLYFAHAGSAGGLQSHGNTRLYC